MRSEKTKFSKVSFDQWCKANNIDEYIDKESASSVLKEYYDDIKLPKRSTTGSAGYDFFMPFDVDMYVTAKNDVKNYCVIPTGIRCEMDEGLVLCIFTRSSLGFKYQLGLANMTGIIDQDYAYADNEGHIMLKLVNNGDKIVSLHKGDKFAQGIFLPYYTTVDDDADGVRTGGLGSTGK